MKYTRNLFQAKTFQSLTKYLSTGFSDKTPFVNPSNQIVVFDPPTSGNSVHVVLGSDKTQVAIKTSI